MSPRRGVAVVGALLLIPTVIAIAPAPARAAVQEPAVESSIESRDLEVLEDLLERSIQEVVERELQAGPAQGEFWAVRVRSDSWARGIYLDGYGVMVTVQLPRIPFFPKIFAEGALRARHRLERELSDLRERLELLGAETDEAQRQWMEGRIRKIQTELADLRGKLVGPWTPVEVRPGEDAGQSSEVGFTDPGEVEAARAEERAEAEKRGRDEAEEEDPERDEVEATPDAMLRFHLMGRHLNGARREAAEQQRRIVAGAAEAVVETLARYGNVVHGLQPRHRLAVVLIPAPSPELAGALRRVDDREPERYVISLPYEEVRSFERGELSLDELRARVVVRSRTGERVRLEVDQE